MRRIFICGFLLAAGLRAQSALVEDGFEHFYNLEYAQAITDFEKAIAQNPAPPDLHNHLAEAILFREMYRNGALESELVSGSNSFLRRPKLNTTPETEKKFLNEIGTAMSLAQERLKRNPKDTGAMYALGISYGLRANYFFLVKKAWLDSLRDATSSRKLHNRVSELEPQNVDARLVQGLHDYVIGSLPAFYRMLGFVVGFHGDKEKGIRTVQDVAQHGRINKVDAEIFLCALYRRERQPRLAIPLLDDLLRRFPRNYLLRFEEAQMYSAIGDKAHAIGAIERVAEMKREGVPGYEQIPWEKIYFQLGTVQFWYRDFDQALENMKKVTAAADRLDLNTGVTAWLRLGQIYDLTHRRDLAIQAYKKAIAYAPQADAARESQRYLSSPYRREKG
ncbi:MAG TPA: tetratricopeptide repeat protein [Bryobacteraceae bacterium]|nr:tetratricopeptide repeat protein [Bryobacteraceae bacterium]